MIGRRAAADSGFTLLELLVAITLLGILLAAIFGSLRLGARAWETSEQRLDRAARLLVVQEFLRQRLMLAQPIPADDRANTVAFEGTADRLGFVTLLPAHLEAGFHEFVLAVEDATDEDADPGRRDLVIAWRRVDPFAGADDEPGEFERRILLEGVESLSLAYFGALEPGQAADWHEVWLELPELPRLIAIRLAFAEGDRRHWPTMIVRPMIERSDVLGF